MRMRIPSSHLSLSLSLSPALDFGSRSDQAFRANLLKGSFALPSCDAVLFFLSPFSFSFILEEVIKSPLATSQAAVYSSR